MTDTRVTEDSDLAVMGPELAGDLASLEGRDALTVMQDRDLTQGVATMCIGVEQGIPTVVERVA